MASAHRSSRRTAGWIAALIAGLLVLAACGGEDAADPEPAVDDATEEEQPVEAEPAETDDADVEPVDDAAGLDTITPGVIKVAIQPYGAYTEYIDGELTGLDSDILQYMADRWGYEIEVEVTDFTGMLGGVQSGRVDTSIGGIAWSAERAAEGLFTDAVYYSPTIVGVSNGETYSELAELEGLTIGTVEGYVWADSIQAIPATLAVYPDATGVIDDLGAKRIDAAFLDLFLLADVAAKRPELGIDVQYLPSPTPEEIEANEAWGFLGPYTVNFYVSPDSPKLQEAMDEVLREMYADGTLAEIVSSYGGDPESILKPFPGAGEGRIGVDRDEGWSEPSV